jgi:hypothetical protein
MPCYSAPLTREEQVEYLYMKFLALDCEIFTDDIEALLGLPFFHDPNNGSDPWSSEILCYLCENIEKMEYKKDIFTPKLRAWYNLHKLVDQAFNDKIENDKEFKDKVIAACKDFLRVCSDKL